MIEKAKNKIIDEMEKNKEDESIQYIGKYLLKQREKLLSQENINKKYIAYYDYLNELKQYNSEIENNYRYIALKAAYSNTVILQEELDEIRNYVEECLTLIQENNSSLKLLIYQYIYVLF